MNVGKKLLNCDSRGFVRDDSTIGRFGEDTSQGSAWHTSHPISSSLDECSPSYSLPHYVDCMDCEDMASFCVENEDVRWVLQQLARWNLEDIMGEVVRVIFSEETLTIRQARGISEWGCEEVKAWLQSLSFLSHMHDALAVKVECECIDGDAFMALAHDHRLCLVLGVDYILTLVLELIIASWRDLSSTYVLPPNAPLTALGVLSGHVSDLRQVPVDAASQMIEINRMCSMGGAGGVYGQLVVLGYSEFRMVGEKWITFGHANTCFQLRRRKLPNGMKQATPLVVENGRTSNSFTDEYAAWNRINISCSIPPKGFGDLEAQHVLLYEADPLIDCFQVGRAAFSSNDFVVPGELHFGSDYLPSGPVSRRACRVACERLPPFRCFLFAGGFSEHGDMYVKGSRFQTRGEPEVDGFTTFGVKLFQPEVGEWHEISVTGRSYDPRAESFALPSVRKATALNNQLTNGSLIDIGGIILTYQDPIAMAQQMEFDTAALIEGMNGLKPKCPVMFEDLTFHFVDSHSRAQNAVALAKNDLLHNSIGYGPIHVPPSDLSAVPDEQRVFVFPSCGHVFGYHASLEYRHACPLCRQSGPFVPLTFSFEKSICDGLPSHVFNPCGHAVSESAAKHWSEKEVFNRHIPFNRMCSICPFCATELDAIQPFSRLTVQTEGLDWQQWCGDTKKDRLRSNCDPIKAIHRDEIRFDNDLYIQLLLKAQQHLYVASDSPANRGKDEQLASVEHLLPQGSAVGDEASTGAGASYKHHYRFVYFPTYAPHVLCSSQARKH